MKKHVLCEEVRGSSNEGVMLLCWIYLDKKQESQKRQGKWDKYKEKTLVRRDWEDLKILKSSLRY